MTLKTRRFLFYLLLFLFVVAATAVIFYSTGFRIDFENQLIKETGGVYVKSNPVNVDITLDGESVRNEAGILNQGTFIDNLEPGTHHLVLNLNGYSGWQKNAEVLPGSVSVFEYVRLVPEQMREKISESIDSFTFSNELFVTVEGGDIFFDGKEIIGDEIIHFTNNGGLVSLDTDADNYYYSRVLELGSSLNLNVIFNNLKEIRLELPGTVPIVKIEPYPNDDSRFIVMSERAIYSIDTDALEIEQIDSSAYNFFVSDNQLFWVNDSGIYSYNLTFGARDIVYEEKLGYVSEMAATDDVILILQEGGSLMALDLHSPTTTVISDNIEYFSLSQTSGLVFFAETDGQLSVYNLDWKESDKDGQFVELLKINEGVEEIVWYENNSYVFLKDDQRNLKFVEIDDSYPINEVVISERVRSFSYDPRNDILYYANDDGLWSLEI